MRKLVALVRAAGLRFSQDGCTFMAQALAFNAVFAIFPLAILIIAGLGYIYGSDQAQARALALIGSLSPEIRSVLSENIRHVVAFRGTSGILAFLALFWSGKNLFQGLAYALNRALDIPAGRPLVTDILVAMVMIPILGTLFFLATAAPLAISLIVSYGGLHDSAVVSTVAGYGTGLVLIFVVTLVLYTYLPNRRVGLSFGVPGAIFVTVAWELAQIAFAVYSTHVNFRLVYGALGAFALLLVWFYYMATIFLFGAELCAQSSEPQAA
jgi:membrane protein